MTLHTQAELTTPPQSLAEIHDQLSKEVARLRSDHPALYDEATKLFKASQDARTQVGAANVLLHAVLALTQPPLVTLADDFSALFDLEVDVPLPNVGPLASIPLFEAAAPVTAAVVPLPSDEETSLDVNDVPEDSDVQESSTLDDVETAGGLESTPASDELDGGESESGGEDETVSDEAEGDASEGDQASEETGSDEAGETGTSDAEMSERLIAAPQVVTWAEGTLGEGIFSQLAQTLQRGDVLSLVITRRKDELLITVIPKPLQHEPGATAIPLQVSGLPSVLDAELPVVLNNYREGRQVARELAAEYALQVTHAAEASRKASAAAKTKAAAKPVPATNKPTPAKTAPTGEVFVEVHPKDALLVLSDKAGKTYPIQEGTKTTLPTGDYTLTADAPAHLNATTTFTIKAGKEERPALVLPRTAQTSMF